MTHSDNLPPDVIQAMCTQMRLKFAPSTISNYPGAATGSLYIGYFSAVQDKDLLKAHNITHLVQVLDVPWLLLSEKDWFNCYRRQIHDTVSVDLRPHLEAVWAHVDEALRNGRNVLVHCQQT